MLPVKIKRNIIKCNKLANEHRKLSESIVKELNDIGIDVEHEAIIESFADIIDYGYDGIDILFNKLYKAQDEIKKAQDEVNKIGEFKC